MPKIELPIEFFRKEREQAYHNWPAAFARELITNSLDEKATEIHISFESRMVGDTEHRFIHFNDNGPGMSREVAENVYLTIGKSSKDKSESSVGGFGRARVLTCFSMESYTIRSASYRIEGRGADYEIFDDEPVSGFQLSADIGSSATLAFMKRKLIGVLDTCDLRHVTFNIDGQRHFPNALLFPKDKATDFGQLGEISAVEGRFSNRLFVRVNGMTMFEQFFSPATGGCVILELFADSARSHLTANRDGPKPDLQNAINDLYRDMNAQGASAISRKALKFKKLLLGNKDFHTTKSLESRLKQLIGSSIEEPLDSFLYGSSAVVRHVKSSFAMSAALADFEALSIEERRVALETFPIFFCVEIERPEQIQASRLWNPEHWMLTSGNREKWKLFHLWNQALEFAVMAYCRAADLEELTWGSGFIVGEPLGQRQELPPKDAWSSTKAMPVFLLNPTKSPSGEFLPEKAISIRDRTAHKYILAMALHEVAHTKHDQHDTAFAVTLTRMIEYIDQENVLKAMRLIADSK